MVETYLEWKLHGRAYWKSTNFACRRMSGVPSTHKAEYQKRKEKEERLQNGRDGLQTLFQVGVCENACDNSSAALAVSVVHSTPEVGSTSDDDNQPSASLNTETTNPSSLQVDFQTSEPKA